MSIAPATPSVLPAMEQSIVDWKNWLIADSKSLGTVTAYAWDMRQLAQRYPALAPFDYKLADLTRYQAERRLKGVGDSARKRSASAVRSFFGYVCGRKSPAKALPVPKVKTLKREPRTLDWQQLDAVLSVCETSRAVGLRDLAIIALLVESGLRNAELCRLELAKVDLERHRLKVIVKGGTEQQGAFPALTATYLANWMACRADYALPATKTLFCSVGGLTPGKPLTTEGLRGIFKKIGKLAGMKNGFSPHDCRRSCATLKTLLDAPTRTVQVGGRWSSVKMVERYTRAISLDAFERYPIMEHLMTMNAPAAAREEPRPPG